MSEQTHAPGAEPSREPARQPAGLAGLAAQADAAPVDARPESAALQRVRQLAAASPQARQLQATRALMEGGAAAAAGPLQAAAPAAPVAQRQWRPPDTGERQDAEVHAAAEKTAQGGNFIDAFAMLASLYPEQAIRFHRLRPAVSAPDAQERRTAIENILDETFDSDTLYSVVQVMEALLADPLATGEAGASLVDDGAPVEDEEMNELIESFEHLTISENFRSDLDDGAEEHRVYNQADQVIVASNPTPLSTIVANKKWEGVALAPGAVASLQGLQASAQSALYKIAGKVALGIKASRSKSNMEALRKVLQQIGTVLSKVKGAPHSATLMKPTDLSSSAKGIEGTHVKARPLSILSASPGSPPSDGRLMTAIRASAGVEGRYYVQMHLLNDLVFGPGELWNLTPGPTQSNRTMETKIEDPLKRAIIDKCLVINFEAKVSYRNDPIGASAIEITQAPDKYRFDYISFKAEQLEYDAAQTDWVPAAVQDADVKKINGRINWDYGSLTPLTTKPRILDAATMVQQLKDAGVQNAAAVRIHAYVQAHPGSAIGGQDKQGQLADLVKKWDKKKTKPNMKWKSTAVLWT